jgi:hypothetical protein
VSRKGIDANVFGRVNGKRDVVCLDVLGNGLSQTLACYQREPNFSHLRVAVVVPGSGECALVVGSFPC